VSAFIDQNRERFGVEPVCRTIGVSASAYYQRRSGVLSPRQAEDQRLLGLIRTVFDANYECYGYRRMHAALRRVGETVGRDQVARLMRAAGLRGAKRRGRPWRTTIPAAGAVRPPDLVRRRFTAPAPDQLWCCDFTYLRTWQGKVYFSFVLDVFSRRVVGWQFASHMHTSLVLDALQMAVGLRAPGVDVLICHSDAGSQYTSADYRRALADHTLRQSIGTVADAYDNALAESFVDSFKTELIRDRVWRTSAQMELAVVEWVAWFNTRRLHSTLDYRTPDEIEQRWSADQRQSAKTAPAGPVDETAHLVSLQPC
jgi:putative transposase